MHGHDDTYGDRRALRRHDGYVRARADSVKNLQAKSVLRNLVKGIHPATGADLPPDAIANDPTVIRALLASIAALEADVARESRRKSLPPSIGRNGAMRRSRNSSMNFSALFHARLWRLRTVVLFAPSNPGLR